MNDADGWMDGWMLWLLAVCLYGRVCVLACYEENTHLICFEVISFFKIYFAVVDLANYSVETIKKARK